MSSELDSFRSDLRKYIEIEQKEADLKNRLNQLKSERDKIQEKVVSFMENNSMKTKDILFSEKKIRYVEEKNLEGITKTRIFERLKMYLNNSERAKQATDFIYADRNYTLKKAIRITDIKK